MRDALKWAERSYFKKALISRSFTVSRRLISSSSRLDSNCLWVRTGLVPPVATCLWSSGHSLGLRHKRKGWRSTENNIYLGALVKTRLTPFSFSFFVSKLVDVATDQRWCQSGLGVGFQRIMSFMSLKALIWDLGFQFIATESLCHS